MAKLSIITINLNNASGLRKTIESVVNQIFKDYEYLIIDGGSSDGSNIVIEEYADKITSSVSETDKGIYNAMNKGLYKAKGDYCFFLNSGDTLLNSKVLIELSPYLSGKHDIVCGSVYSWHKDEKFVKKPFNIFSMSKLYNNTLPHQACFIKQKLFSEIGYYNENLKIVSDWEFLVKCAKYGVSYMPLDIIVTTLQPDGISIKNYNLYLKEREDNKPQLFLNYADDLNELFSLQERKFNSRVKKALKYISIKRLFHFFQKQFFLAF